MTKHLLTALFLFLLLFSGCPDSGVNPPPNPLGLTVENVTSTQVFLNLSLDQSETNRTVTLKRGDSTIFSNLRLPTSDTLVVDEGLLPNKTYTYTLSYLGFIATAQATTQDTTSHAVQWQVPDTLGAQGLIRDCWIFSRDNAWAVGEIYLADSTGKPDMANPYNAAHWDGNKWEVKQIMFYTVCGQQHRTAYPISSIFAFSNSDIWFAVYGDQVVRWDGNTQTSTMCMPVSFTISKIWGESSNSVYAVGNSGIVVHYTNGTWTKMESHTSVDLQDIWGIDDSHVWATGTTASDGHSVVLQYDGKQWTTIYDNSNATPSKLFYFNTVWTDNVNYLYLDGGGLHKLATTNNNYIGPQIITGQTYPSYRIRSTSQRDMFDTGQASEVAHFNGVSWYLYPELKAINDGFAWFYSAYPTKDFILIGGVSLTSLNGVPIVIRGYR